MDDSLLLGRDGVRDSLCASIRSFSKLPLYTEWSAPGSVSWDWFVIELCNSTHESETKSTDWYISHHGMFGNKNLGNLIQFVVITNKK